MCWSDWNNSSCCAGPATLCLFLDVEPDLGWFSAECWVDFTLSAGLKPVVSTSQPYKPPTPPPTPYVHPISPKIHPIHPRIGRGSHSAITSKPSIGGPGVPGFWHAGVEGHPTSPKDQQRGAIPLMLPFRLSKNSPFACRGHMLLYIVFYSPMSSASGAHGVAVTAPGIRPKRNANENRNNPD